jgi:hypothetical protein
VCGDLSDRGERGYGIPPASLLPVSVFGKHIIRE